jgi:hypothetical protein
MKHADRMLLHHIDHATGDRLPSRYVRNLMFACMLIGSHALVFVIGCVVIKGFSCVGQ